MPQYQLQKSYKYQSADKNSQNDKDPKVLRIYADGVYDCFHFGHARQLQQAKLAGKKVYLIAGVSDQEETQRLKGKTLMDEQERTLTVQTCCWVDEVLCPCPWVITTEFLDIQEIDYVAHDAIPYQSSGAGDIYSKVKTMGKFLETQRTEGISTSDLIMKIIVERDKWKEYLLKNGVKRTSLGVGFFENVWIQCKFVAKALCCLKRKKKSEEQNEQDKTKSD